MAVPVTLSFPAASAGNRFYEDLQKLGRRQPKLCQTSPAKFFSHKRLPCKCFWQLPRSKNTSRELLRLRLAHGKEAEDSFIPVWYFLLFFVVFNSCELMLMRKQNYETSWFWFCTKKW